MTNDPLNSLIRAATWCVRIIAIAAALVVLLLLLSFTRLARGAENIERISGPSDWVGWALSDIAQLRNPTARLSAISPSRVGEMRSGFPR